jgi:hypothetical protein
MIQQPTVSSQPKMAFDMYKVTSVIAYAKSFGCLNQMVLSLCVCARARTCERERMLSII